MPLHHSGPISDLERLSSMETAFVALEQRIDRELLRIDHKIGDMIQEEIRRTLSNDERIRERFNSHALDDEHVHSALREKIEAVVASTNLQIVNLEKSTQTALVNSDKAIAKAEFAADKRFDSVNEFRKTLSDQAAEFVRTPVLDSKLETIAEKTQSNTTRLDRNEGRGSGLNSGWAYLVGAVGVLLALLSYLHTTQATINNTPNNPVPTQTVPPK